MGNLGDMWWALWVHELMRYLEEIWSRYHGVMATTSCPVKFHSHLCINQLEIVDKQSYVLCTDLKSLNMLTSLFYSLYNPIRAP
jgi:hypothetical protein